MEQSIHGEEDQPGDEPGHDAACPSIEPAVPDAEQRDVEGGARGDLALAREAAGPAWPRLLETAERAAACFPRSPVVGVDVLPTTGWRDAVVGEVNAFGDLLPGLTGLPGGPAEGLDTYGAQIAALLAAEGHRPAPARTTRTEPPR